MASELHSSIWILIAWVVGGIITLFGALSNAEVAGLLADTGGEFVYLKKIYNRFFSFMYGWSLLQSFRLLRFSSLAYGICTLKQHNHKLPVIFSFLQHLLLEVFSYPFQDFGVKMTAILLILVLTGLNILRIKKPEQGVSKALTVLVFIGLLTIVFFGLRSVTV